MIMSLSPETRQSLLLRLRDSADQQAWTEFYEIYQPLIYRFARTKGLQDAEACDVVQDVVLTVNRAIERFEHREHSGSFRKWLRTITKNVALNQLRRCSRERVSQTVVDGHADAVAIFDNDAVAEREFEYEHRRQVFLWAANQLQHRFSPQNWSAFWRTCVDGVAIEAVAEELDMEVGAIYVARCRVIARIREIVELRTAEENL